MEEFGMAVTTTWRRIGAAVAARAREEDGFSTAELLGNAALGILALVAIWGALQVLGVDVIEMVREELLGAGSS